jgi:hypothetical protein
MSRPALSDLLPDFGSRSHPSQTALQAVEDPRLPETGQPAEVDIAAIIADEVAKAEAAVTERLTAIYEATLQSERDNHAAERDALSHGLGTEAAALITTRLAAMEQQLLDLTTTAAARILGGLLTDEVQKRAVAMLSARIGDAIHDNDAVRIRVMGPQSLCEALATALGEHAANVQFAERASFDVTVNIDSSIYETRLAEWSSELAGVLT